jgi:hypothetical protein
MTDDEEVPLTLSRDDLYELVWSKPMLELAKDFGISDRGLAKRCKRLGIPVPGRGYWARVDAGQSPYRPKLPKREEKWSDQSALKVAPSIGAYTSALVAREELNATSSPDGTKSIPTQIQELVIAASTSILEALPPIKRTALRRKHAERSQLTFERGEKTGALVDLVVTDAVLDRALLVADTLLRAAESLGWTFDDPLILNQKQGRPAEVEEKSPNADHKGEATEPNKGRLLVEGEQVAFLIEERFRIESREPSAHELAREKREYSYHAPRKVEVATGALRVVRIDTYRRYWGPVRRSWYDRKGKKVEQQLPEVLLGFYELALATKARRAKDEKEAREEKERQRRKEEWEALQEANDKLIDQLETDAGAWHRARYLRRYVVAARRALGSQALPVRFREETINFLTWAEGYVNQLDPLHSARRTGAYEKHNPYYHGDLEDMKKSFGRLLGSQWSSAWKLGQDYTPKPTAGYSYREKSVFEVGSVEAQDDDD